MVATIAFTMRREILIPILWVVATLCCCGVIASMSWIESYKGQIDGWKDVQKYGIFHLYGLWALLSFVFSSGPLILGTCILVCCGVGALVSIWFALWVAYTPHKKSNLPSSRTQNKEGICESPQTQTEESSNESGPPPLPLPRRPR